MEYKREKGGGKPPFIIPVTSGPALVLRVGNLTTAIHPGLQIDMVAALRLAGAAILNPVGRGKRVVRTAHVALGRAGFFLRYGHFLNLKNVLIEAPYVKETAPGRK